MFNAIDSYWEITGRLSYVTVLGGTAFFDVIWIVDGIDCFVRVFDGSEMSRRRYKSYEHRTFGHSGLAIIIPPSALAVYWQHWHKLMSCTFACRRYAWSYTSRILSCNDLVQTKIDRCYCRGAVYEFSRKNCLLFREVLPMVGIMVVIIF